MAQQFNNDTEFEKILASLDGLEKATPAPFFYTRLKAKMLRSEESALSRLGSLVTRPAFALVTGVFLLFLNGYFLLNKLEQKNVQTEESTQMLAIEYTNLNSTIYENPDETP